MLGLSIIKIRKKSCWACILFKLVKRVGLLAVQFFKPKHGLVPYYYYIREI